MFYRRDEFDPERPFADSPMNGRYAPHCGRARDAADAPGTFPLMADSSRDSERACNSVFETERIRGAAAGRRRPARVPAQLRTKGLIGGLWRVEALGGVLKDFVRMSVRSEDEGAAKLVRSRC